MPHSHRPTLKQKNKAFKSGGHASSRSLKEAAKGKISQDKKKSCVAKVQSKQDRRNMAKQIQQNKQKALKSQASFFGDGRNKASRICALISLSETAKPIYFVNGLQEHFEQPISATANATLHIQSFKQRLQFIEPSSNAISSILDAASIADFVIFLISANEQLADNPQAQLVLRALQAQGIPSHFSVIPDLKYDPDSMIERNDKECMEVRKMWQADMDSKFPVHHSTSIYVMDSLTEIANMIRKVCTIVPDPPSWRTRAYIVPSAQGFEDHFYVEGIVRGGGIDPDRTVHVPAFGDFLIDRIQSVPNGIEEAEVLATPTEKQDTISELEEHMMDEPELPPRRGVRLDDHYYMDDVEAEPETAVVKKLPPGTSDYQATWIMEATDEELDDDDSEDAESVTMSVAAPASTYAPTQTEAAFEELSDDEEARQLATYRSQIQDDKEFPDEIDFDPNIPARERFRKYRGLKDFRTSHWDPEEIDANTPSWHSSLLKFQNYKATRNRIFKSKGEIQGRVRVYLRDVPRSVLETPVPVIWANREFEHLQTVNNMTIQMEPDQETIKSKSDVIVQIGHRRFMVQPIFSQNIIKSANGLVKYERFVKGICHATFAGPAIIESTVPVLYFSTSMEFIGTGSFVGCNHSRLLIRRILLTGDCFKVQKRAVTVRYMFHNPLDVAWFKAIQLFTKTGRTGYIKESLGTHGYMKTQWDRAIQSQDTVFMPLYKRIYPRLGGYVMDDRQ